MSAPADSSFGLIAAVTSRSMKLLLPRTPGHMAGPVLASAYCRYGCPAGQSGSQRLGVLLREFVAAMTTGVKSV